MLSCAHWGTGALAANTAARVCQPPFAATQDRVLRVNLELVHVFANVGILERTAREAVPVSQAPATTTESATRLRLHVHVSPDSLARHATLCAPHPEVFDVVGTARVMTPQSEMVNVFAIWVGLRLLAPPSAQVVSQPPVVSTVSALTTTHAYAMVTSVDWPARGVNRDTEALVATRCVCTVQRSVSTVCAISTTPALTATYRVLECLLETAQTSTASIVEAAIVKGFVYGTAFSRPASGKLAALEECALVEDSVNMVPMKVEFVPVRPTSMAQPAQLTVPLKTAFRHSLYPMRSVTA